MNMLLQRRQCLSLALAGLAGRPAWGHATDPTQAPGGTAAVQVSERAYPLPALRLQRADGRSLALKDALFDGRPVVLTFMYSSCATVCPITNQTLVAFEQMLGADAPRVNLVSVSIDPDHDTVGRLARYARDTGAKGSFFTSDPATSEAVQRAFDAWRGDKMNHQPVFLLNTRAERKWVRLDGLVGPKQLMQAYRQMLAQAL